MTGPHSLSTVGVTYTSAREMSAADGKSHWAGPYKYGYERWEAGELKETVSFEETQRRTRLATQIRTLRDSTAALWKQAVDTAAVDGGENHETDMVDSARQALECWDDALRAIDIGSTERAVEALQAARALAAAAGGADDECRALAVIAENSTETK